MRKRFAQSKRLERMQDREACVVNVGSPRGVEDEEEDAGS